MKRLIAAPLAAGLIFLSACSSESSDTTSPTMEPTTATTTAAPTPTETVPATPMETTATAEATMDIVDTAAATDGFSTLVTAVTAAGLDETLKGEGPFTVFAPTDEAFAALPDGTLETLLADPDGQLAEILKYHVVPGKVMAADVVTLDGQEVETVQGSKLTVEVADGKVVLVDVAGNRVNVTATDVEASNGVIHVIDGVLLPTE